MTAPRLLVAALVAAAVAALGGCSSDQQVDTARAEAEIKRAFSRQTGAKVKSVRCPDEVKAEKGGRFRCVARAGDGSRVPIRVTQLDDEGSLRWRVAGAR